MFHPKGPTFFELAHQALSSTERGYDLLAPKFDFTPFRTPDVVLACVTDHLRKGPPIATAIDLFCGTGAVINALVPVVSDEIVGIDFSQGMLDEARRVTAGAAGPEVRLVRGDVFDMQWEEHFDLAACFGALGHVPYGRETEFLERVRRVLRPGGRFVFMTCMNPSRRSRGYWFARGFNAAMHVRNALVHPPFVMFYLRFTLSESVRWLEGAGFSVRVTQGCFPEPFGQYALVEASRTRG